MPPPWSEPQMYSTVGVVAPLSYSRAEVPEMAGLRKIQRTISLMFSA